MSSLLELNKVMVIFCVSYYKVIFIPILAARVLVYYVFDFRRLVMLFDLLYHIPYGDVLIYLEEHNYVTLLFIFSIICSCI